MKKKMMKRSLALGALMAFVITGSAMAAVYENVDGKWQDSSLEQTGLALNAEVSNSEDGSVIKHTGAILTNKNYGIAAFNNATVNVLGSDISIGVSNTNDATGVSACAVTKFKGNALVSFTDGGKVNIGNEDTKSIVISATSKLGYATGVEVIRSVNDPDKNNGIYAKPSLVKIKGDDLQIKAHSDNGLAVGIWAQNNTGDINNPSTITIDAKNTVIDVTSGNTKPDGSGEYSNIGIVAYSSSKVIVNNNLTINAGTAISTRGDATTIINKAGNGTVKINGDINFNYDAPTSGTDVDATVDINLNNSQSYLNGNIFVNGNPYPPSGKDEVNAMILGVSNGAVWTSDKDSFVNNLTVKDGGIINMAGNGQKLSIDNLTADSAVVKTNDVNNQMVVSKDANAQNVTVEGSGAIADQIAAGETDASKLADVVVKKDETAGTSTTVVDKVTTDEGVIGGRFEGFVDEKGNVTGSQAKNTSNVAISEMGSIALMAWRQENNDMNKRLGELRNSNGEHGIWTRMTRGESEFKSVKNQYNAYQIGYDEKLSTDKSWTVGAALTYTDAQSSFAGGSGENTHKGFAVYGSKLNEDGSFIDLIAKYARLEHEFDAVGGIGKGEYDTNGYSVSAEYGKRFDKGNGFWVEPQVELTYGKVGSVNYATDKAMAYQDGMESLVGRVGFSLGKDIKDGNVYVRASYLYDFDGETEVTMMSKDGKASDTYEQDLGGGWFEVGVGTNINLSDATYVYFDVEKTYGGDVATPWQWNAGVRYSF